MSRERHDVSDHQRLECLLIGLFRQTSKITPKPRPLSTCGHCPQMWINFTGNPNKSIQENVCRQQNGSHLVQASVCQLGQVVRVWNLVMEYSAVIMTAGSIWTSCAIWWALQVWIEFIAARIRVTCAPVTVNWVKGHHLCIESPAPWTFWVYLNHGDVNGERKCQALAQGYISDIVSIVKQHEHLTLVRDSGHINTVKHPGRSMQTLHAICGLCGQSAVRASTILLWWLTSRSNMTKLLNFFCVTIFGENKFGTTKHIRRFMSLGTG